MVDSPDAARPIIDRLKRHFEVLDEDWKTSDRGYSDRKLLIRSRGGDGTVGEVQIIPNAMKVAKFDLGGQALMAELQASRLIESTSNGSAMPQRCGVAERRIPPPPGR